MILEHLERAAEEWRLVESSYDAYRAALCAAGVPVNLDGAGNPTSGDGTPRDLIDCIGDLAARHAEAMRTAFEFAQAVPEACPITGRPFAGIEEHPERGWLAMYYDDRSVWHSIPDIPRDVSDGPASGLAYDPETEEWSEETAPIRLVREEDLEHLRAAAGKAAAVEERVKGLDHLADEARGQISALRAQRDLLAGTLRELASACRARSGWLSPPVDRALLGRAEKVCGAATGDGSE